MDNNEDNESISEEAKPLLDKNKSSKAGTKATVWSYLVLMSSALSFALAAGFNLGIAGALTISISEQFNVSLEQASWVTSIRGVFYLMTNPLSAILARLISIRKVQFLGFITSIIGVGLGAIATEYWHTVILLGVVSGVGLSFTKATRFGILPYHFEKQRLDMAISVVYIGAGAGYLLTPGLASYLFSTFSFNSALLILAAAMFGHLPGVFFFSQEGTTVAKADLPESVPLRESLTQILTDAKVHLYVLASFSRKFGQSAFFTISQDYAIHSLGITLTESGLGGSVYGGTLVGAILLVMVSHAVKLSYSKLICLVISATLNGLAIMLITAATSEVSYFVFIGIVGLAHGIYIVNSLGVGKDLVGSKHLILITGCESFGTGLGGFIAPPITSYLQARVGIKSGMYASGLLLICAAMLTGIIGIISYYEFKKAQQKVSECR